MDKQPPLDGWEEGTGPHTPIIKDDKLYGRGSVDDGYSVYGGLLSIKAL
jgi:acetylornithine deacetylase/succinyl-diaminopimelate desuccinylase-like protein